MYMYVIAGVHDKKTYHGLLIIMVEYTCTVHKCLTIRVHVVEFSTWPCGHGYYPHVHVHVHVLSKNVTKLN